MRIAIITGEYPPHQGGVGDYTLTLSQAIRDYGHDIRVFTSIDGNAVQPASAQAVPVTNLAQEWRVRDMINLRRILHKWQPDLVNIQYEPAAYGMQPGVFFLPQLLHKYPIAAVVTYHDILPPYLFPKAGKLRTWIVRYMARRAMGSIFTNTLDRDTLTRQCGGELRSTTVIPIGSNIAVCPPSGYDRAKWRTEFGFSEDAIVIGFFGFRNRSKGLDHLIDAVHMLRQHNQNVYVLFIGGHTGTSDPSNLAYANEIDERIRRYQLDRFVTSTGFTTDREVSAALLGIDICALPYLEGANLRHGTLHAALAHGCAIVTTQSPEGKSELEDGQQALLVPPGDTGALVKALNTLISIPTLRQRIGGQANAYSRQFAWPVIAQQTISYYQEVLDKTARP